MSIEAHLQSVANKRAVVKSRIAEEMAHPRPNFGLITELKKQNLALKEEMARYLRMLKSAATG